MIKGIILVGGPTKNTNFRPLCLDLPEPLFPGIITYCLFFKNIKSCWYWNDRALSSRIIKNTKYERNYSDRLLRKVEIYRVFIKYVEYLSNKMHVQYSFYNSFWNINRYIEESKSLGTAGALCKYRD